MGWLKAPGRGLLRADGVFLRACPWGQGDCGCFTVSNTMHRGATPLPARVVPSAEPPPAPLRAGWGSLPGRPAHSGAGPMPPGARFQGPDQMGSLAGAAHLLQENAGVLRYTQGGQKPPVDHKGKCVPDPCAQPSRTGRESVA